jgi:hypothetical protein
MWRRDPVAELVGQVAERGIESRPAAERVDGLEAAGGDQPGPGIPGNAFLGPALHRRGERFLHCFLGQIEVAEQADESREHSAGFSAVGLFYNVRQWVVAS